MEVKRTRELSENCDSEMEILVLGLVLFVHVAFRGTHVAQKSSAERKLTVHDETRQAAERVR